MYLLCLARQKLKKRAARVCSASALSGLPPGYRGKGSRLQYKLATMETQVLQEAALNILQEAKTNESAREELKNLMLDNTSGVFML